MNRCFNNTGKPVNIGYSHQDCPRRLSKCDLGIFSTNTLSHFCGGMFLVRNAVTSRISGLLRGTVRRFHRDQNAQMLMIGAIFVFILVVLLTVTVNLGYVTHQKIQAQNASDAAAMSAAIWQIRGLSMIQSLNNAVVYSDGAAFAGLMIAIACNKSAHFDPTGLSYGVGNVALGITFGAHAISQFVLVPFRDIYADNIGPSICYISASEMARANNATPVLNSLLGVLAVLVTDASFHSVNYAMSGGNVPGGDSLSDGFPDDVNVPTLIDQLPNIPIYALNVDLFEGKLLSFDLEMGKASHPPLPPIYFSKTFVMNKVKLCYVLQPMQSLLFKYFMQLNPPWRHDYLKSKSILESPHPAAGFVHLGPSSWITVVRESSRDLRYQAWTSPWQSFGGLGLSTGPNRYGELGATAVTSVRVFSDKVTWFNPLGYRGWVELVPTDDKALANLFMLDLDLGVMH